MNDNKYKPRNNKGNNWNDKKRPNYPPKKKTLDEMIEEFLKSSKDRQEKRDYSGFTKKRKSNKQRRSEDT